MRSKVWIPILAAVFVVCVAAVIVLVHLTPGNPSALESVVPENTEPENAMVAEFKQMLAKADQMLTSGNVITMNNHEYVVHYVNYAAKYYPEAFSYTAETYSIDTARLVISTEAAEQGSGLWHKQHTLRYLLLLTQIIDKYPDCFVLNGRLWDDPSYCVYLPPELWLCAEYKTAGYERPEAYFSEVYYHPDRYSNPNPSLFCFNLHSIRIRHYLDADTNYYYKLIP